MPTEKGNSLLFGIGPQLMKEKNYQFPFYRRLAEKHGKVFRMKVAPGKYLVVLSDPEDVDFVQQNEGKYPNRGSALRVMKLLFSGDLSSPSSMLATSDGPEWKKLRSELNPVVNPRKLGRHVERLDPVSQTFLEIVQESVDKDGYSRDLMEFLPFWSMKAIARFLYPKLLNVQRERDQRVVDTYDGMQLMFKALRLRYIPLWVLKYLPLKAMKEGKEGVRKYQTATHSILADMERNDNSTAKNPTEGTFYEQWKAQGWTHETILLVMADFLAAGTDTVST
jgi:cytochrome P450